MVVATAAAAEPNIHYVCCLPSDWRRADLFFILQQKREEEKECPSADFVGNYRTGLFIIYSSKRKTKRELSESFLVAASQDYFAIEWMSVQ